MPVLSGDTLASDPTVPTPPPNPGTSSTPGTPDTPGHWNIPDYNLLLGADAILQAARARMEAAVSTAGRSRASAIQQAIIGAGFSPTGWANGFGDLNANTLQLAGSNPNSTLAQLKLRQSQSNADLAAALGARGTLSSGALTGGVLAGVERPLVQLLTAGQNLLSALAGYENSYAQTFNQLQEDYLNAEEAAAQRIYSTYQPTWVDPVPGTSGSTGTSQAPDILAYSTGVPAGPGRGTGVTIASDYGKNAYDVGGQYVVAPGTPKAPWEL